MVIAVQPNVVSAGSDRAIYVLTYPLGESIVEGNPKDNELLAQELLVKLAQRMGCIYVGLPEGWTLQRFDDPAEQRAFYSPGEMGARKLYEEMIKRESQEGSQCASETDLLNRNIKRRPPRSSIRPNPVRPRRPS